MSNRKPSQVDGLLHAFFRHEMPKPWPTLAAPPLANQNKPTGRRAWVLPRRGALAAAVALFLGSYFLVASWFPPQQLPSPGPDGQFYIGQKLKLPPRPEATERAKPLLTPALPHGKKGPVFPLKGTLR